MFIVSGNSFDISSIINEYAKNSIERQLLEKMSASNEKYSYDNIDQLKFELTLRKNIVNAAIALDRSGMSFADFKNSRCNPEYWKRVHNGGFLLKEGADSGEAVNDIFINGGRYATECATAVMIIYYKALLDTYGEELFNKKITQIYLMDWDVTESLLRGVDMPQPAADILIGDRGYFNNPDFDRSSPEWQGENVIVLPDSMYFGHGIGLTTADEIIRDLNSRRMPHASQHAYLMDSVGRPDFKKLSDIYYNVPRRADAIVWKPFPAPLAGSV